MVSAMSAARRRRERRARKATAAQKAARAHNRKCAYETQVIMGKYALGPMRDITPQHRTAAYARLGIDPLNPNPDGSDYHLMNVVDDELETSTCRA
jgi:hypothetical protein